MKKKLVIAGASGFGREVAWVVKRMCPEMVIAGFSDDAHERGEHIEDIAPFLGSVASVLVSHVDCVFFCAIGKNRSRSNVMRLFAEAGVDILTIVDPTAVIAPDAMIGAGSFVGINTVVSVGCKLGRGVIVNHNVTVGHDVQIEDFAQLCPGVCVSGGCAIGEGALLGTLAGTIPLKRVGMWATVGAGVTALRDVADGRSMIRLGSVGNKPVTGKICDE